MLVLSRKAGERVLIGERVAITIVRINGQSVRLGIDAPPEMVVVREELAQRAAADPASIGSAESADARVPVPDPLGEVRDHRPLDH
jgi:carbon storage regulator